MLAADAPGLAEPPLLDPSVTELDSDVTAGAGARFDFTVRVTDVANGTATRSWTVTVE